MKRKPSTELQNKRANAARSRDALILERAEWLREWIRERSAAVCKCTKLPDVCSGIIAEYARAASPYEKAMITVDCFGDIYSFCLRESDTMSMVFKRFENLSGSQGMYYFYPANYDSNLCTDKIMPTELCFEYRNSTVYCRLRIDR
jgi:hypothetical protein